MRPSRFQPLHRKRTSAWPAAARPISGPASIGTENDHLAAKLREHLRAAGIDRPELFTNTEHRRHVCALDARATFITISLTNGKSETWISDRTGHRSSAMIQRYNRKKRMLKQLLRGKRRTLVPLDEAIPELSANPNEPPVDVPDEPDPEPETDEDDDPDEDEDEDDEDDADDDD